MTAEIQAGVLDKLSRQAKRLREQAAYARQAAALAPHIPGYKERADKLEAELQARRKQPRARHRRRPRPAPKAAPATTKKAVGTVPRKVQPRFAD